MFDRYVQSRTEKRRKWVTITITTSLIVHVAVGIALVIYSFWKIERLQPRYVAVSFRASDIPAPPAPPPPPPPPPKKTTATVKKIKLAELVQPPKEMPTEDQPVEEAAAGEGVEGGVEGGGGDGVLGGVLGGVEVEALKTNVPPPPPPPPPPEKPQIVPAVMLRGNRVAGNEQISMPDSVKQIMAVQGIKTTTAAIKLCLSAEGSPSSINWIKRSGYPDLDSKIELEVRQWRYRPWNVNGRAVPICTSVTFNFRLQ